MKKDLLIIGFVLLFAAVLCRGVRIQSVEDYYLTHADDITPDSQTSQQSPSFLHSCFNTPFFDSLPEISGSYVDFTTFSGFFL